MERFLIIQTAFIGDVILATALVEQLAAAKPDAEIDMLVRKGNESLLSNNPHMNQVIIWDKKTSKYSNLFKILRTIRKKKYTAIVNLQRFAASGFLTVFGRAESKLGFSQNPFSFFFNYHIKHDTSSGLHEIERNSQLLQLIIPAGKKNPKLYPGNADFDIVKKYTASRYVVMAPASVWFTKQLPAEKWNELIQLIPSEIVIYLVGAASDQPLCEHIIAKSKRDKLYNLSGKFSFLQTAALMKTSSMNYVNDSAPLHISSAVNAPTTAIFCSTLPEFGFGPLADESYISEIAEPLDCRPCGLHGLRKCPESHFKCAHNIQMQHNLK